MPCTISIIQQDVIIFFFFFVLSKFRFFTVEVIREMDNNVRLDKGYLSVSESRGQSETSLLYPEQLSLWLQGNVDKTDSF